MSALRLLRSTLDTLHVPGKRLNPDVRTRRNGDHDHDDANSSYRCGRRDSLGFWIWTRSRVRLSVLQEGRCWTGRLPIRYLRAVFGGHLRYGRLLSAELLAAADSADQPASPCAAFLSRDNFVPHTGCARRHVPARRAVYDDAFVIHDAMH